MPKRRLNALIRNRSTVQAENIERSQIEGRSNPDLYHFLFKQQLTQIIANEYTVDVIACNLHVGNRL